jgi:hypothetical protein
MPTSGPLPVSLALPELDDAPLLEPVAPPLELPPLLEPELDDDEDPPDEEDAAPLLAPEPEPDDEEEDEVLAPLAASSPDPWPEMPLFPLLHPPDALSVRIATDASTRPVETIRMDVLPVPSRPACDATRERCARHPCRASRNVRLRRSLPL